LPGTLTSMKKITRCPSTGITKRRLQQETRRTSHKIKKVVDFQIEIIDPNIKCDTSYEIIKTVWEYKGEEEKYVSRRKSAKIAMGQYARGSKTFYSALSIIRNKITGMANDALTHNGAVTNVQFML